jgi:hypothetical protein
MRRGRWIKRIVCCGGGMTKARLTVNRGKKLIGDRMKEEDVACDPCNRQANFENRDEMMIMRINYYQASEQRRESFLIYRQHLE